MDTLYGTDFEEWLDSCGNGELEDEFWNMRSTFEYARDGQCGISTKESSRMRLICAEITARYSYSDSSVICSLYEEMTDFQENF